jgi:hypothetical protein
MGNGVCQQPATPSTTWIELGPRPSMLLDEEPSLDLLRDLLAAVTETDEAFVGVDEAIVAASLARAGFDGDGFATHATDAGAAYQSILDTLQDLTDEAGQVDPGDACGVTHEDLFAAIDTQRELLGLRDGELALGLTLDAALPERAVPAIRGAAPAWAFARADDVPPVLDVSAQAIEIASGADAGAAASALMPIVGDLHGVELAFVRYALEQNTSLSVQHQLALLEVEGGLLEAPPEGYEQYEEWRLSLVDWQVLMAEQVQANVEAVLGALATVGDATNWQIDGATATTEVIASVVKAGVGVAATVALSPAVGFFVGYVVGKVVDAIAASIENGAQDARMGASAAMMSELTAGATEQLAPILGALVETEQAYALTGLGLAMAGDFEQMWALEPDFDAVMPASEATLTAALAQQWIRDNSQAAHGGYMFDARASSVDEATWCRVQALAGTEFTSGRSEGVGGTIDSALQDQVTTGASMDEQTAGAAGGDAEGMRAYQAFAAALSKWRVRQRDIGVATGRNLIGATQRLGDAVGWNAEVLANTDFAAAQPGLERMLQVDFASLFQGSVSPLGVQDGSSAGAAVVQALASKNVGIGAGLGATALNLLLDVRAAAQNAAGRRDALEQFQDSWADSVMGGFAARTDWAMGAVHEAEQQTVALELAAARLLMSGGTAQLSALAPTDDVIPSVAEADFYRELATVALTSNLVVSGRGIDARGGNRGAIEGLHRSMPGDLARKSAETTAVLGVLGLTWSAAPRQGARSNDTVVAEVVSNEQIDRPIGSTVFVDIQWRGTSEADVAPDTIVISDQRGEIERLNQWAFG